MATLTEMQAKMVAMYKDAFEAYTTTGSTAGYAAIKQVKHRKPAVHSLMQRGALECIDRASDGTAIWYVHTSKL